MPITAITIENFKGIREPVRIELKPITLLFGPNSSGKSTIIQALHYAREIFERENTNPDRTLMGGDTIDLGGFKNLVHKHDPNLPINIRFDLDLSNEDLPQYETEDSIRQFAEFDYPEFWTNLSRVQSAWVEISVAWSDLLKKAIVEYYEIGINGEHLATIETIGDAGYIYISGISLSNPIFFTDPMSKKEIKDLTDKLEETIQERLEQDTAISPQSSTGKTDAVEDLERLINGYSWFDEYEISHELGQPIGVGGQGSALPKWGSRLEIYPFDSEAKDSFDLEQSIILFLSSLIEGPGELVRDALRKFSYLGPLRIIPPRNFEPALTPDESRWANGMAAWDILFSEDEFFLEKFNEWLSGEGHLDAGYRVTVKEYMELDVNDPITISMMQETFLDEEEELASYISKLQVKRRLLLLEEANNIEVQPLDIGVGISQIIPVIVAGLSAQSGFVAIEQPDLHIHPKLQVAIGDLFIEQIKENPDVIFILETHSEHLLLRLLRKIRQTSNGELPPGVAGLSPESLIIHYLEITEEGISVSELKVSEDGDSLNQWPAGFFEERSKELF